MRCLVNFLILIFLNMARGDQGTWMEKQGLPKNIILILSDSLSPEMVTQARSEQAKTSLNVSSSSLHVLPFERLPTHGVLVKMTHGSFSSEKDLFGLQTIFNGPLSEEICESASKRNYSSNILLLAQKAGKASGLVTTTDVTARIPASIYTNSLFASGDCLNIAVSNCTNVLHHLVHGDIGGNMDVILGKSSYSLNLDLENEMNDECSNMDPDKLFELLNSTNRMLVRSPEELNELSPENGKKVFGIFPKISGKHLQEMTLKALDILNKNENGFFLTVIIERKNPTNAVRMVSEILERFIKVNSLVKALLIVTSASTEMSKRNIPCNAKHSSQINIEQNNEIESSTLMDTNIATKIEQSMTTTALGQKNIEGMSRNAYKVNNEYFYRKTMDFMAGEAIPVETGTFGDKLNQYATTISPDEGTVSEPMGEMITTADEKYILGKKGTLETKTYEMVATISPVETEIYEVVAAISTDKKNTAPKKEIPASKRIQVIKSSEMPPNTAVTGGDGSKNSLSYNTESIPDLTSLGIYFTEGDASYSVTGGDGSESPLLYNTESILDLTGQGIYFTEGDASYSVTGGDGSESPLSYNTESILDLTGQGIYSKEDASYDAKNSLISNTDTRMDLENTSDVGPMTTEKFTDDQMSSSSTLTSDSFGTPSSPHNEVLMETSIFDQTLITTVSVPQSYTTENMVEKQEAVEMKDTNEISIGNRKKREGIAEIHLVDMPIYASGPASNLFRGVHKLDFLWKVIKESICLDQFDLPECDRHYAEHDEHQRVNLALDAETSSNAVSLWHWSQLENILVVLILIIILN